MASTKSKKTTKPANKKGTKSAADGAKLAAQLEKIQAQVALAKDAQSELKKQGKELSRVGKAVDRSQDELENFKDWTRSYFDEVIAKFDLLATEQARLTATGPAAPAPVEGIRPVAGKQLARLQEELVEVRQWVASLDEKFESELAELRRQVHEARELAGRAAALPMHHAGHHGTSPEVL